MSASRSRVIALASITIALILSAVFVVRLLRTDRPEFDEARTAANPFGAQPGWTRIPNPPVPPRQDPALVWTGKEVLLFGGNREVEVGEPPEQIPAPAEGGASYDPAANEWRELPAAPPNAPIFSPQGLWTGSEWILAGVLCDREKVNLGCRGSGRTAAAYDPEKRAWRMLSAPPDRDSPRDSSAIRALTWDGRVAIFSTSAVIEDEVRVNHLFAYDPAKDSWSELVQPPFSVHEACAGDGGTVVAMADDFNVEVSDDPERITVMLAVYSAQSGWRQPAAGPTSGTIDPQLRCGGKHALLVTDQEAHRLNVETLEWGRVDRPSSGFEPIYWGGGVSNGTELFFWSTVHKGLALNVGANRWRSFPAGPHAPAFTVAGSVIVTYLGAAEEHWGNNLRMHVYAPAPSGGAERSFPDKRSTVE